MIELLVAWRPRVSVVMHIELEEWQARLALHFATLRDSRRARGIS